MNALFADPVFWVSGVILLAGAIEYFRGRKSK